MPKKRKPISELLKRIVPHGTTCEGCKYQGEDNFCKLLGPNTEPKACKINTDETES